MPYDLKCVNPMTQSFGFIERSDLTKRDSACYGNCQVRNYECNTCIFLKLIILEAFNFPNLVKGSDLDQNTNDPVKHLQLNRSGF